MSSVPLGPAKGSSSPFALPHRQLRVGRSAGRGLARAWSTSSMYPIQMDRRIVFGRMAISIIGPLPSTPPQIGGRWLMRSSPLRPAFLARAESADRMYQPVDVVGRGGKRGDETDDTRLPTAVVKAVTLVQKSVDDVLGQVAEEDVRPCRARKASAGNGLQPLFEPRGHGVGVPGIAQPKIVGEVGVELGGGETHLGGELSGSLSPEVELGGQGALEDDDRIGGYAPVLDGAKGQHVHAGAPGQLGGVAAQRGDGVGEAGAIHMNAQARLLRNTGQVPDLGGGV